MLRSLARRFSSVAVSEGLATHIPSDINKSSLSHSNIQYKWKSAIHKEMTVLFARKELVNKLYQRFGYRKAMETRLIGKPQIQNVCKVWATYFVDRYPNQWSEFLTVNYVPGEVLETKEWQDCTSTESDPEVRWLLERICKPVSEDSVPFPKYPKMFAELEFPKWPYNPYESEWMAEHYGLLKYPYLRRGRRDRSRGSFTGSQSYETEATTRPKPEPRV
eukprot:GDKJ01041054.1.p1 GENE.GDKJ01041054.1~~GDKJ01041054.1.p1  ORF type:complete len:219 (+),score=26.17 GDKJ01041054.1:61-717(+)